MPREIKKQEAGEEIEIKAEEEITPEKIGRRLGEFVMTRGRVMHSAPGVGATRGSKHIPLK